MQRISTYCPHDMNAPHSHPLPIINVNFPNSSVGTTHSVATDFNPLVAKQEYNVF
ncbi:MAG: hypothetical protein ACRC6O_06540 [Flavobacterium sp.]